MFLKKKVIPITSLFNDTFVDIHSHLLPGIDDGAKVLDDSIQLISRMASLGIKKFVTTPHVLGDVYPNTPEIIYQKLEEVRLELHKRDMHEITINAAAEYMMDEQFSEILEKGHLLTLRDSYILVEMSYFNAPLNLYDLLFDIQIKGYVPVLAHPERYNFYHHDFDNYYKLKKAGCLFQLNLLSLTDHYGKGVKKISEKLLKLGLYDFIGTDTHHHSHLNLLELVSVSKKLVPSIEELVKNNTLFSK